MVPEFLREFIPALIAVFGGLFVGLVALILDLQPIVVIVITVVAAIVIDTFAYNSPTPTRRQARAEEEGTEETSVWF